MICVIAKLAPDATERLNTLRQAVASEKLPLKPFYGHITIATYLPDDEEFVQVCSEIIRETPSFRIRYAKLEVLSETSDAVLHICDVQRIVSHDQRVRRAEAVLYPFRKIHCLLNTDQWIIPSGHN